MQIPFSLLLPSRSSAARLLSPCCRAGVWRSRRNASCGPDGHALVYAVLATSSRCQRASAPLWLNLLQPPNKTPFLPGMPLRSVKQTGEDELKCPLMSLLAVPAGTPAVPLHHSLQQAVSSVRTSFCCFFILLILSPTEDLFFFIKIFWEEASTPSMTWGILLS